MPPRDESLPTEDGRETSSRDDPQSMAGEMAEAAQLSPDKVAAVAPLVGIGCKSGDTVTGLSGVRRTRNLALVFVDAGLSPGTVAELRRLERDGTRVLEVASMGELTAPMGRDDLSVVAIKRGSLARGIEQKLAVTSNA